MNSLEQWQKVITILSIWAVSFIILFMGMILIAMLLGCADDPAPHWCRGYDETRSRETMAYEGIMIPYQCDWRNSSLPEHTMRQIELASTESGNAYMLEHPADKPKGGARWSMSAYHAAAREWKHLCQVENLGPYCYQGILP